MGDAALLLADRVGEVLREPVELDASAGVFAGTASIGVAVGRYTVADALLRDADLALYAAKAAGKDRYVLFDAGTQVADEGFRAPEADPQPSPARPGSPERLLDG